MPCSILRVKITKKLIPGKFSENKCANDDTLLINFYKMKYKSPNFHIN